MSCYSFTSYLTQHMHAAHTGKEGELAAAVDRRNAIEVFGLKKRYGGSQGCCGHSVVCCSICDCCSCLNVPR
jgi:hypothetical protein